MVLALLPGPRTRTPTPTGRPLGENPRHQRIRGIDPLQTCSLAQPGRAGVPHLAGSRFRSGLVVDGMVVAAVAEERISRRKHTGDFPRGAIAYCLAEAGLGIQDVDELAHGFDYAPYRSVYLVDPVSRALYREVYSRDALLALVARDLPGCPADRVRHVGHHLAHAASAYYTSGWDEGLGVVIDGVGEAHSVTVYHPHQALVP